MFRARDRRDGSRVALKILRIGDDDEPRARLFREAAILERLHHPGIVRYIAHGETRLRDAYLAMEWIDGETLASRLARSELTTIESVRLVMRVAENLSAAHLEGIVHRDITPANVILRDGNLTNPTLIDFGIARLGLGPSSLTSVGSVLGTFGYMAPEQASGVEHLDARADVFALGAMLFRCLTGVAAYSGEDDVAILSKLLSSAPPRARALRRDLPVALDELLARMMSREPADRPRNAGVVAAQLAAVRAG